MPDHDGEVFLQVETAPDVSIDTDALWAIQVPFDVTRAPLEIGTIMAERPIDVPRGRYNLVFEADPGRTMRGHAYSYVLKLTFSPATLPTYKILKRGDELQTDRVLRKDADPIE